MNVLFLDDNDARLKWAWENLDDGCVTLVMHADQAIQQMRIEPFDVVYLDHDLGGTTYQDPGEENSGSGVVRWIVANKPSVGRFVVHSMNTPAANRMVDTLRDAGYEAEYVPFMRLIGSYGRV